MTDRRVSPNNLIPSATFAALMGLSAGTTGSGKPRGNSQLNGTAAAKALHAIAAAPIPSAVVRIHARMRRTITAFTRPRSRLLG